MNETTTMTNGGKCFTIQELSTIAKLFRDRACRQRATDFLNAMLGQIEALRPGMPVRVMEDDLRRLCEICILADVPAMPRADMQALAEAIDRGGFAPTSAPPASWIMDPQSRSLSTVMAQAQTVYMVTRPVRVQGYDITLGVGEHVFGATSEAARRAEGMTDDLPCTLNPRGEGDFFLVDEGALKCVKSSRDDRAERAA